MILQRRLLIIASLLGSALYGAQAPHNVKSALEAAAPASAAAKVDLKRAGEKAEQGLAWKKLEVSEQERADLKSGKLTKWQLMTDRGIALWQRLSKAGIEAPAKVVAEINAHQSLITHASKKTDAHQQTEQWLAQNKDFVEAALGNQLLIGDVKPYHETVWKLMATKGLQNLSNTSGNNGANYIFRIPGSGNVVNIAGHCNRRTNMKVLAGDLLSTKFDWNKRSLTSQDVELFQKQHADKKLETEDIQIKESTEAGEQVLRTYRMPCTYQTISRFAAFLLFKATEKQLKFKHVETPETHLVHVPCRPTHLSDMNYVVVQQYQEDLENVGQISADEEGEIVAAIKSIGLVACNKGTLKRRKSDKKIIMLDFEQPDSANPRNFFNPIWSGNGLEEYEQNFVIK